MQLRESIDRECRTAACRMEFRDVGGVSRDVVSLNPVNPSCITSPISEILQPVLQSIQWVVACVVLWLAHVYQCEQFLRICKWTRTHTFRRSDSQGDLNHVRRTPLV